MAGTITICIPSVSFIFIKTDTASAINVIANIAFVNISAFVFFLVMNKYS